MHADDGFISRFEVVTWPNDLRYIHADRPPNKEAKEKVASIFKALANIEYRRWGASGGDNEIPSIRLSADAQVVFDEWFIDLETKILTSKEHPLILEHLAKFRSFVPKLALVNHLVRKGDEKSLEIGQVCKEDLLMAIAQAEYFESHARRMYGLVIGGLTGSVKLANRILCGDLMEQFTVRDVYRNGWSHLNTIEAVEEACKVLCGKRWLRAERTSSTAVGGRPTLVYRINPKVYQWANTSNN